MDSKEIKPTEVKKDFKPIITEAPPKVKKSPMKTFMSELISDDISVIGDYLIHDVLVPTIQNTIVDTVCSSIAMIFRQDRYIPPRDSYRRGEDYALWNGQIKNDYGTYYRGGDRVYRPSHDSFMEGQPERNARRANRYSDNPMRDYLDYPVRDPYKAEQVIRTLKETIDLDNYDAVSVADFYRLVGYTYEDGWIGNHSTLHDIGWFNLDSARITRDTSGIYHIMMPKAVYIK